MKNLIKDTEYLLCHEPYDTLNACIKINIKNSLYLYFPAIYVFNNYILIDCISNNETKFPIRSIQLSNIIMNNRNISCDLYASYSCLIKDDEIYEERKRILSRYNITIGNTPLFFQRIILKNDNMPLKHLEFDFNVHYSPFKIIESINPNCKYVITNPYDNTVYEIWIEKNFGKYVCCSNRLINNEYIFRINQKNQYFDIQIEKIEAGFKYIFPIKQL